VVSLLAIDYMLVTVKLWLVITVHLSGDYSANLSVDYSTADLSSNYLAAPSGYEYTFVW
jgi:hypothetical protein